MDRLLVELGLPSAWVALLQLDLLGRLLLAAVLGGIVGVEREISGKAAGLRTNLLICVGSALFTALSLGIAGLVDAPGFRSDPGRIAAQIVTGIGFLGAGTILQSRGRVTGLTTAATVWVVAAIGMAVGAGAFAPAVGTTVLVMCSLVLLVKLERFTRARRRVSRRYVIRADADPEVLRLLEDAFREAGMQVRTEDVRKRSGQLEATLHARGPAPRHERAVAGVVAHPGVHRLRLRG